MDDVQAAYDAYNAIDQAADKDAQKEAFVSLIGLVHGSSGAKRLAAQFIPKFFKFFPTLSEKAIDALLDLCEDEELVVRTITIQKLPSVVKDNKTHSLKITDVLTQLLQAEDAEELNTVRQALLTVIQLEPKGSIMMIFDSAFKQQDLREKTLEFLSVDLMPLRGELFAKNEELEKLFALEIKKVLNDVNSSEFSTLAQILLKLKMYEKDVVMRQELADALVAQLPAEGFDPSDEDTIRKVLACAKVVIPILESGASSAALLSFFANQILPPDQFKRVTDKQKTAILRPFVDCLKLTGPKDDVVKAVVPHLRQLLLNNVALPSDAAAAEDVKLDFSRVECIAFACYLMCMRIPEAADGEDMASRFRVLYQASQNNVSKLKLALSVHKQQKEVEKEKASEKAIVVISNIFSCELLKQPRLRNKLILHPSWKAPPPSPKPIPAPTPAPSQDTKRRAPDIVQPPVAKKAKQQQLAPAAAVAGSAGPRQGPKKQVPGNNQPQPVTIQRQKPQQQPVPAPKVDQKLYVPPAARGAGGTGAGVGNSGVGNGNAGMGGGDQRIVSIAGGAARAVVGGTGGGNGGGSGRRGGNIGRVGKRKLRR
ncbi:apoptosis inhibitory protein 5-domain-containing protein [Endogone sp. FLAS-F59071]|nr:apoptosis inhibitory protein 5-domain-containing protein [Endogone sp. FLAS-F59071]|eukprot:RUS18567.1 apoptosis inhibitory protein 5-domain-containing protein [Endogone sp. FLAS-F59071]